MEKENHSDNALATSVAMNHAITNNLDTNLNGNIPTFHGGILDGNTGNTYYIDTNGNYNIDVGISNSPSKFQFSPIVVDPGIGLATAIGEYMALLTKRMMSANGPITRREAELKELLDKITIK